MNDDKLMTARLHTCSKCKIFLIIVKSLVQIETTETEH